ncbi:MAG: lytic transglycosylase domain-containing protein [Rhodospirillales bacterium]|nr:lytic transglycosylase domain-containing protein [Rhodospirillales bacterium]
MTAKEVMGPVLPPQKLELAEEQDESATGFNVLDFTASLLDFIPPPTPPRKPKVILTKPTAVEALIQKARAGISEKPIARDQAKLYEQIFEFQREGKVKEADALIEELDDPRLLGHVLFQRYMHPNAYTSSFAELRSWLELFADHPGADRIYKLAVARKPIGENVKIQAPDKAHGITRLSEPTMRMGRRYVSSRQRTDEQVHALNALNREIFSLVRKGQPSQAYQRLQAEASLLDNIEYDLLRGEIAAGYLYNGKAQEAGELAAQSVKRSGLHVPKAGWVAGLVAWRDKRYSAAARHFEVVARSSYASSWTAAAGAYWAARAHMRTGNVKAVSIWLRRGLAQPRTFYGLISTRALGRDFDFNWKVPAFTKEYMETLSKIPAANRAMALVLAGQPDLAQAELIRIRPENDAQHKALLSYAAYANLPGLALRAASGAANEQGGFYDAALYPTGPWQPVEGYKIDPALVHAIMRQESRFDPRAKSPSGAKGLMQLMPATAKSLANQKDAQLDHPETNLELGQRYLEDLLGSQVVENDLLYLLIAYNAGPGNLAKWKQRWSDVKDPLLFIELIPSSETRAYVERVLSNYWIYRLREDQDTPTLDAITAGQPAKYNAQAL